MLSGTSGSFGSGGTDGPGGQPFSTIFPTSNRPISGTINAIGSVQPTTLTVQQIPGHTHNAGSSVNVSPGSPGIGGRAVNTHASNITNWWWWITYSPIFRWSITLFWIY